MGKWFQRSPTAEREAAQAAALKRFTSGLEKAAEAADQRKLEAAPKPKRQVLPSAPTESLPAALARLGMADQPTTWSCPCRTELLDLGLIERVYRDNLWAGDRLTEKGWQELALHQRLQED